MFSYRNLPSWIILLAITGGCTPTDTPQGDLSEIIQGVETRLSPRVHIKDDSLWTIEQRMTHYGVPGVAIAVIHNNKIEWSKTYGVADKESKEPVTARTLFQAGSISKPVAAYGALKFVQAGTINMDETVNNYLRSWQLPDNEFTKEKKVSIKHLLTHTGGLTVHGFWGYSPDLPVPSLLQVLNGEAPANSPPIRVDKMPGESWRYSGGGYTIMQQMLIDIDGKSFPDIMKEQVLAPLGMINSTYSQPLPSDKLLLAASGYLPDGTMTKGKRHTYPEMAAAGLWTTAEDLARFAIDVQKTLKGESEKVLSQNSVTQLLTPSAVADHMGLGLFLDKHDNDLYFGHGGWDEGFSSNMVAHKDKGYGVVVLTNSNHPDFIDELIRAVALTYRWDSYVPTYEKTKLEEADILKILGRYAYNSDEVVRVYREGDRVFSTYLRFAQPMELFKISDSTFVRKEREARVQFKTNPADGNFYLTFLEKGKPVEFTHPKMEPGAKVPYEWLLEGDYQKALEAYTGLKKSNAEDASVQEQSLNQSGYDLLSSGQTKEAVALFKINIQLYPTSANVYDSYAEACMKNGDNGLAIVNYKKSLALNPDNEGAKKRLEELRKKAGK
jgi:CubicO group peptidase (beta-lactamase class C family)